MNTTYIIFEIQTDASGKVAFLPAVTKNTEEEAWSAYYQKLSYAVCSSVPIHNVMLCTNLGRVIDTKCYTHIMIEEE